MLTEQENGYLGSQRLARLATVSSDGQPTVDAVVFTYDGARFIIGGYGLSASRKYRNVAEGNDKVSLIVDDLAPDEAWAPRGIKLHGVATIATLDGHFGPGEYLVIAPTLSWSWGVIEPAITETGYNPPRRTVWQEA